MTQWDFQNKGKSGWIDTTSFDLEVPLCNLRPTIIVPHSSAYKIGGFLVFEGQDDAYRAVFWHDTVFVLLLEG